MKEKTQLQVFLVFLFIVCAMALSQASFAAVVLTPSIAGYSASSGRLASAAGSFTMTAANDGFIKQAIVNVGGKAVTMPATLRMAANAGQIALAGMRLNPWGIAGTLAAAWLLDKGMEWAGDHWTKTGYQYVLSSNPSVLYPSQQAALNSYVSGSITAARCDGARLPACYVEYQNQYGWVATSTQVLTAGSATTAPATDQDWDSLPDPTPSVAPELPYAPYMPDGVPVDSPEYQPADVPLGQPYTKPDGSTAQSRAKISPSGDGQVTVAPYEQQVTDTAGNPVSNPTPQPTPDPPTDPCDQHPERLGCMSAGSDNFAVPMSSVPLSFTPEAAPFSGTCPAPINVLGQSIFFQSSCDAMIMIRPLVLAFAAVMAAFILLDTFRGAA